MNVRTLATALLVCLTLATAARAQERPDPAISDDVSAALRSDARLTIFDDVDARVEGGTVHLQGKVTTAQKRAGVEARMNAIDGVRGVRNAITVLPSTPEDDALRRRVAHAIYSNPAFWSYAAMPHPPIHIVVEASCVTLTGVVQNSVERAMARSLAAGAGTRPIVNALRTVR